MFKKRIAVLLGLALICSLSNVSLAEETSQDELIQDIDLDSGNQWESLIIDKLLNGEDETSALWKRLLELKRDYRKLEDAKDELEKSMGLLSAEKEGLEERVVKLEAENAKYLEKIRELEMGVGENEVTTEQDSEQETGEAEEALSLRETESSDAISSVSSEPILNDNKEAVSKAQLMLSMLGYPCGPLDGKMGEATKISVHDYKTQKGMDDSTDITESLLKEMRADLYPEEREEIMKSDFLQKY